MFRPRHLVPSLAALVAINVAQAYEIDMGDGTSMSIEPRIQSRLEIASASDAAGDDFDIWSETTTENPRSFNFFVRRARLYFDGVYQHNWKWNVTLMADEIGLTSDGSDNDNVDVRYATIGYQHKADDFTHFVRFGLQKHTAVSAEFDSSSSLLFPTARIASNFEAGKSSRGIGLDYFLKAPIFGFSTGIADDQNDAANDLLFYARVHTSFKEEWALTKRKESYLGKEGFGHQLGIGIDVRTDGSDAVPGDPQGGTEDDDATTFVADYLVHWNQLTAAADLLFISRGEAVGDNSGIVLDAQAGWALPLDNGQILEPALRLSYVDADDDDDEEMGVYEMEGGDSGIYVDLGVNWYLNGHHNKFQLAATFYTPEEGDGDAFVIRLQHQLDF